MKDEKGITIINALQRILDKSTIIQKIFETNSSFYVKQQPMGNVQFLFFRSFWLVLKNVSIWQEDWAVVYNSSKFRDFTNFS